MTNYELDKLAKKVAAELLGMKAVREYITTIRKGLVIWEHWTKEGNTIISKHKESFPEIIRAETATIRQLNPQDVKDAILEHEDGIAMRIKRLDEYKLQAVVQYLADTADTTAQLSDTVINSLIDEYRLTMEAKTRQLLKVIKECEKYIQHHNDPIIEAAVNDRTLLAIFGTKQELEKYILYCKEANNGTEMARKAAELYAADKIKYRDLNSVLHGKLKDIGLDVGTYNAWRVETRKTRLRLEK